ncbi:MAG: acetyl-CoA carboxylase biotin carboxyl carrier protein subunit [Anaerolineaceae bacterium]|nr:acetyl-CoA carboxylase biotin carboxyl carrier protein subunit [Anaerolineaceae bacterium]MBN2676506.1 acetyl-CoA carboxylase biotin carboxyl carrier protein subunit [Anaerolineaceae bacterium]
MTQYHLKIKDTTYEVELLGDPRQDEVQVKVNGEIFTVMAEDTTRMEKSTPAKTLKAKAPVTGSASVTPAAEQPVTAGPGTIRAPLPGVINAIKVQSGQKVKANDEICVIEAMKAMNVIRSQRDGTITRIHVSLGSNIAHGAPLMDIE